MAEVKMRFNLNTTEVELVVDGQVALTSGKDVFESWVEAYNKLNPPVRQDPVNIEKPVEDKVVNLDNPDVDKPEESGTVELDTAEEEEKSE